MTSNINGLRKFIHSTLDEIENSLRRINSEQLELSEISEKMQQLSPILSEILSKWVPEILYCLFFGGELSFNQIKNALNVSSRVLSDKLKLLEERGLVERKVVPGKPPRVFYSLTEEGRVVGLSLVPVLFVVGDLLGVNP